jgi:hypothetical protein
MTGLDAAKVVALLSVGFMCAAIGGAALDVRVTLKDIAYDVHQVTTKAGGTLDGVKAGADRISSAAVQTMGATDKTLKQVARTVAKLDPSLDQLHDDLKEAHAVEHDARLSLDNVNKGAIAERLYFEKSLPDLLLAVKTDVDDAGGTLQAAKDLVADPNLKRFLAESADTMDSWKGISGDLQFKAHQFAHPDKKRGFIAGFEGTGDVAKHWIPSLF